ncbi:FMN reductase [Streptomyces sp. NBC_01716]|uniref:FMN reductase n=1 Tax=Streptomyces sp. NBC_01716 TaxID=2975917 RepID=UPI002E361B9B|nr:FMN reductase [Streptomyces sp. NBC_01716]
MKLVVISAGLSLPSSTRLLADRLADATRRQLAADGHAVDIHVVELRDLATDIAHVMATGFPGSDLNDVLETVEEADGVIAVSPIFSASYSGLFKSFFDVLDNTALTGKPVLIAATGGTARHSLALEHALRPLFSYLHATVVPTAVYAASEDWGAAGDGADGLADRITRAGHELAALMGGRPATAENTESVVPFEQQLAALRPE